MAFLVLGTIAGFLLPGAPATPARAAPVEVTDARTCAALAVYKITAPDDWTLSASVAAVVLNNFEAQRDAAECGSLVGQELAGPFSMARWQYAVDVVGAVESGDYSLPADCLYATRIVMTDSAEGGATSCVIGDYAFVRGAL